MTMILIAVAAYLCASFIASALIVRTAPGWWTARVIRKQLGLFVFLPILLVLQVALKLQSGGHAGKGLQSLFEKLSGRKQYKRVGYGRYQYGYGKARRSSDPRPLANGHANSKGNGSGNGTIVERPSGEAGRPAALN